MCVVERHEKRIRVCVQARADSANESKLDSAEKKKKKRRVISKPRVREKEGAVAGREGVVDAAHWFVLTCLFPFSCLEPRFPCDLARSLVSAHRAREQVDKLARGSAIPFKRARVEQMSTRWSRADSRCDAESEDERLAQARNARKWMHTMDDKTLLLSVPVGDRACQTAEKREERRVTMLLSPSGTCSFSTASDECARTGTRLRVARCLLRLELGSVSRPSRAERRSCCSGGDDNRMQRE